MEKTLSSQTLRIAVLALENMGIETDSLLKEIQVSRLQLANPLARVPIKKELLFWKLAMDLTGDPQFAVRLVQHAPYGAFPLLEYLGASSQSLHQALVILCRYVHIVYGAWHSSLSEEDVSICFNLKSELGPEEHCHTNEFGLGLVLDRLRRFSAQEVPLLKVMFRHQLQGDIEEYRKLFKVEVLFGQDKDALIFDKKIRELPCKHSDNMMMSSLLSLADTLFSKLPGKSPDGQNDFINALKNIIQESLSTGEPDIEKAAKKLSLSARTLQRRLMTEGTSFKQIVINVRMQLAQQLIKNDKLSNEDIAFALGYSTLSAFSRAFKQWFNMTISEYRKIR